MNTTDYKAQFPAAFPKLTETQMAEIATVAHCRTYNDGDILFKAGETEFKFHVIQRGEIAIIDRSTGEPVTILVHEPFEFTGDVANLSGRSSHMDAVAKGTVEVYEICQQELKDIISQRPELSDIILKAFIARYVALMESDFTGIRVIGSQHSQDTFRIRDFLSKNQVLFTWMDVDNDNDAKALLQNFHVSESDTPIVAYGNEWLLRNPSNIILAEKIGIKQEVKKELYDLIIVGAGPGGLAAAVYGASEGLNTVVMEMMAPGGQAGTSSKIENYLGFPTGVSGTELAARATMQAEKFGAHLNVPAKAVALTFDGDHKILTLDTGEVIVSKALIIASGAEYRKLEVPAIAAFEGRGVYYAATNMEAKICEQQQVVVVGGGNSAGQAAIFLAGKTKKVYLIVRGKELAITMSQYLEQRIRDCSDITLLTNSEITAIQGNEALEGVTISNKENGTVSNLEVGAIFSFIGAIPRTEWLGQEVAKDDKGFIKTGTNAEAEKTWPLKRPPYLLETTKPGVFAIGDVRCNSVKRVSSAVGEGSMAVQFVHEYLKEVEG